MNRETQPSISAKFGRFIHETGFSDIDGATLDTAKGRILDNIAAAVAGSYGWEQTDAFLKSARTTFGAGDLQVYGRKEQLSAPAAAMANATFAHSIELDDGHRNAGVHAGAIVVPVATALAEHLGKNGRELVAALVVGYEITYRIARNMNPAGLLKGFHPSAICGTFGAAAAAAKLLDCDAARSARAIGLAGLHAAGLMEATASGQASKCIMLGHAAMSGIFSAICASNGIAAPEAIMEGKNGVFRAMSENVDAEAVTAALGERFEIGDTYIKLYPNCRHIHAGIEAVFALREKKAFHEDDIEKIVVGTHPVAYNLTGEIHAPGNPADARFSMSYCLAAAIANGAVGMADFEPDAFGRPGIRALERKISVRIDDEVAAEFPQKRGAKVEIFLKNGEILHETVYRLKGSPDLPASRQDIERKFANCAAPLFDDGRIRSLISRIGDIENAKHLKGYLDLSSGR